MNRGVVMNSGRMCPSHIQIYNRQLYKQQLASIGLEGNHERRYFSV